MACRRVVGAGMAVALTLAGALALSLPGLSATVTELESLVQSEVIREISMAAGLALAEHYAATRSVEELQCLAESGRTPGIRLAAQTALDRLEDPLQSLVLLSEEELLDRARIAETAVERLNAARAYYVKARGTLRVERLETDASDPEHTELAIAAGEILGGFYVALSPRSPAELEAQTTTSPFPGLRLAASLALSDLWIRTSTLSDEEIIALVAAHTIWQPDLAEAYMRVLAVRYSLGGGNNP